MGKTSRPLKTGEPLLGSRNVRETGRTEILRATSLRGVRSVTRTWLMATSSEPTS
eukprot:CAMPEP_0197672930 /NCGR_PEP_ID=MMETSP1338-20131121/79983_1 /TAXON_ID=43686 ORGANISM="Pelagodinium beii, Strain RCC1491" /NCGR_SAMPLE_ID=MMETSP1338 /ASSEMBLY_ACC=CAM_ASM_000754 /LENGTH=54 /DNA_ID=CAMNT_0043253109 /DNA_START=20 /DNA_END=181 /DNA_ORIENTATION=+